METFPAGAAPTVALSASGPRTKRLNTTEFLRVVVQGLAKKGTFVAHDWQGRRSEPLFTQHPAQGTFGQAVIRAGRGAAEALLTPIPRPFRSHD
jgi:hypothetical protein